MHAHSHRISNSTRSDLDIYTVKAAAGDIGFISGYFSVQISIAINVNCNLSAVLCEGPIFNPLSNIILQIVSVNFDNIASVSSSRPFIPDMENQKIPLLEFRAINSTCFVFAPCGLYRGRGFGRSEVSFKRFEHAISRGRKLHDIDIAIELFPVPDYRER